MVWNLCYVMEVADKANQGKEASPRGSAEVGRH